MSSILTWKFSCLKHQIWNKLNKTAIKTEPTWG
jgi:hypothetical protein